MIFKSKHYNAYKILKVCRIQHNTPFKFLSIYKKARVMSTAFLKFPIIPLVVLRQHLFLSIAHKDDLSESKAHSEYRHTNETFRIQSQPP